MDEREEYTVNDDLRVCGLPADDDDDDDLTAGAEALFGSSVAPINVDAPDDAGAGAGGDGVGASATQTPASMPTTSTANNIVLKHARSGAWNDFEPIFETLPSSTTVIMFCLLDLLLVLDICSVTRRNASRKLSMLL